MWIKTEDGRLYNLQNTQVVEPVETETGWVVTARYKGTSVRATSDKPPLKDANVAVLTPPKAEDTALRLVDEIAHAMQSAPEQDGVSPLLDLTDIPVGHRRQMF